jgi:hypothetical protein
MHSIQKRPMPKSKIFEQQYPTIHRFVEEIGWIEIGLACIVHDVFIKSLKPLPRGRSGDSTKKQSVF